MQSSFQFDREQTRIRLKGLYGYIYQLMVENEEFREIKYRNRLIKYVWASRNEFENAESITRLQRKVITDYPHLDTEDNIKLRSNREQVYHKLNSL